MPPKVQPPGKKSQAQNTQGQNTQTQSREVKDAQALQAGQEQKAAVQPKATEPQAPASAAEALSNDALSNVSESERSAPNEPLSEAELAELEGLALTAKLNEGMAQVFAEPEWQARIGVFDEPNRVEHVPADSVITWATPQWVDHGMHLNWLLTTAGHRLVHPREVSSHRDGRGMFVPGRFENKGDHIEQNGSVLCIVKKAFAEQHRAAVYQESRRKTEGAVANFQASGDNLDERGAHIARRSDKVDMGRYTPMRDA